MHLFFDKLYTTKAKRPPLKAILLLSEMEPEKLKEIVNSRRKLSKAYSADVTPLGQYLYRVNLSKDIRGRVFRGYVLLDTSQKGIWIAFTNEETYFVTRVAEMFFDKLYPKVSRLYLNYSQIRAFLEEIKDAYKGRTTLTSFTVKRQPKKWKLSFEKEKGTLTLWEENAEEELMKQSRDYRLTIDRLNFDVMDERGIILLQAHISRKGLCKLRFGDFSSFYENVVLKAITLGLRWKQFYDKRERTIKDGEIKLSPFRIMYKEDLEKQQLIRLSNRISKTYSCSIIHGGNPYFVANICDYDEGSSFGVTALGNVVTITPIVRATPEAIWKLANKVQELLGDGEIVDVGKEGFPEGHILVAMEVDAGWWRALRSCVKLANTRAENKIWVHITDSEDAKEDFENALKDIQKLLKMRNETKESFGNFATFLKTPDPKTFKMKRIF